MKSIAFYLGDFRRSGGTERACIAVATELAKRGEHDVYLIVTNAVNDEPFFMIDPSVNILFLSVENYKRHYFKLLQRIRLTLMKRNIDVIVAAEVMSLMFILPIFILKSIFKIQTKLWVWEHFNFTVDLGKRERRIFRKLAGYFADVIVVLTKKDEELWRNNLRIKGKILSINNPSPFVCSPEKYDIKSKNIIAVGRLTYQKGFDRLLQIWCKFIEKHPKTGWKLQIIGSGPNEESLSQMSDRLKLASEIEWVQNTPDIKTYYENASFLVMTSRFEGLPMTLIEAQSFGLPIVAYDCLTGPSEVISNKSGILVPEDNADQFVRAIETLVFNECVRSGMSDAAKEEMLRFSNSSIGTQWSALINRA